MRWDKYVVYDVTSPSSIRWKVDIPLSKYTPYYPEKKAGDAAGALVPDGYFKLYANGEQEYAHRLIWAMFNGPIPEGWDVDHKDGDRSNNEVGNLRLVTRRGNLQNQKMYATNSSGVTGVSLATNKKGVVGWRARWYNSGGKEVSKTFTFYSYADEAFNMACKTREEAISALNTAGARYTERHGK